MYQYNEQPRVVFKGDDFQYATQSFQPRTSKITQWTIKCSGGLIQNEKQANVVLLGFAIVAIIVSLFLFFGGDSLVDNSKDIKKLPAVF